MNESRSFQRLAGISGLLVTLCIAGNVATLFASVRNNPDVFSDASLLLPLGSSAARIFHLSMVFDVLAYLLFAPVVVFCWSRWRHKADGPMSLYAFCGLAYSLLGSLGGVIVDAVLPRMMQDFAAASPAQQEVLKLMSRFFYLSVAHGIWNPLEILFVSVWFLGFGLLLRREHRGLGILAIAVACVGLLDPLGWIIGSDVILNIGGVGTVLLPVWTAWFGVHLLRSLDLVPPAGQPRPAAREEVLA